MKNIHLELTQRVAAAAARFVGHDSSLIRHARPVYELVLRALSLDRGIPWEINGAHFRIDPRYRHMLARSYDSPVADFLRRRVRPGSVCFDIGANVGVYVLQLARWSGPSGRVVAFEPNPEAVRVLSRHVILNGFQDQVTIVPRAVGTESGELSFFSVGADGMSRLGEPNPILEAEAVRSTVPVTSVDDFVRSSGIQPDWMIIDIEGYEFEALRGAREVIRERGDRLKIVVEFHPPWSISGTSEFVGRALLDELRLCPEPLTGQKDVWREYGLVHLASTRTGGPGI